MAATSRRRRPASGSVLARLVGMLRRVWDALPGMVTGVLEWLGDLVLAILRRLGVRLQAPTPAAPRRVVRVAVG